MNMPMQPWDVQELPNLPKVKSLSLPNSIKKKNKYNYSGSIKEVEPTISSLNKMQMTAPENFTFW